MPPSERDLYREATMLEMIAMIDECLIRNGKRDTSGDYQPSTCGFCTRHSGLLATREDEQVFECNQPEVTFCRRCEIGLCNDHAQMFALEVYCPDCRREVRAEMLPILHEA